MTETTRIAAFSVLVGIAVLAMKTLAWWVTGSVALLSDALESIVNVATALAALLAVRIAERPADDGHPYGHHKAELFSATLEGVLIILAALFILREAWAAWAEPRAIAAPALGIAITGIASVVNGLWAAYLVSAGRRLSSPALGADGRHLWTDVISSAGVILGIGLALATGWLWLDPLLAALVAVNILWSGAKVIRGSADELMDAAVPAADLARLREIIHENADGALEAHDLRTRNAGRATFVEFHLIVPGEMSVLDAHAICDRIEAALKAEISECTVTIHVEPEHKAKASGIVMT
ncbi:cation diffusion facilitator family transporter [Roseivivax halotolerans]|uniref:Protein p34 n=1 Tax=Roseivivax halotolerans TaxID=93684 RepID=A0A1I5W4W3_9RHOB|nr:cation diffusion facilitator family transporter [Roseivivax halotolerans]SFQ14785.1 cation diffusion facilitator family transporter [Roseivivax halotolerans]